MKALSTSVFKKRFRLTQTQLNELVNLGRVQVQQNGYKGDSMHHYKLVVFPDDFTVPMRKPRSSKHTEPPGRLLWLEPKKSPVGRPRYQNADGLVPMTFRMMPSLKEEFDLSSDYLGALNSGELLRSLMRDHLDKCRER